MYGIGTSCSAANTSLVPEAIVVMSGSPSSIPLGRPRFPDLGDLAIAIVREPLHVAPKTLLHLCDLLVGTGLAKRRLVEDLALGDLRAVDLAGLGNRSLLLVRERALIGAGLRILLPETLHRELERALRAVVGHRQAV